MVAVPAVVLRGCALTLENAFPTDEADHTAFDTWSSRGHAPNPSVFLPVRPRTEDCNQHEKAASVGASVGHWHCRVECPVSRPGMSPLERMAAASTIRCTGFMTSPRLLIVANRLPVCAHVTPEEVRVTPSSGGVATGLGSWHERADGLWIGWPGDVSNATPAQMEELTQRLLVRRLVSVDLSPDLVDRYYHGFANRVLWPTFHYSTDRLPVHDAGWDAYQEANGRFAQAVAEIYRPGDTIWVHDYQLMLLPSLLRSLIPGARIGFFLHIPFPSSEVFRILPWRREILGGVRGSDLIGFHTFAYMRHFMTSLLHVG